MSTPAQAVPPTTKWPHASSGTTLKRLLFLRIDNFFSFPGNRARFPIENAQWRTKGKEFRLNQLIPLAVDTLQLHSVKDTGQQDVTNAQRYAVLTPLTPRLEGPEHYSTTPTSSTKENETDDEASRTKSPSASSKNSDIVIVNIPDTPATESPPSISNDTFYNKLEIDELLEKSYTQNQVDDLIQRAKTDIQDQYNEKLKEVTDNLTTLINTKV